MALPANIHNIIFDLGGVLLNLDTNATVEAFKNLGLEKFSEIYSQTAQKELFDDFETGKISAKDFREKVRGFSNISLSDEEIDNAWNAMLLDLPQERLTLLDSLWEDKRLFLLSNTNEIHINAYSKYLLKEFDVPNLSHLFEKEYYSYKIGMRKPNADIFEYILKENNMLAKETLFIDDSPQHVEGASKCGIQAIWLDIKGGKTILDIFL
jgi:FMN phosphatase YigB (HAD superfamily)